ncbi:MAG: hypothetical protein Q3M30_12885 [Candidatus Electrothrix sp. Rat3]|nr:hypothetical protein [Candidatus Electrothrix rattekaaiensis]
MAQQQKQTGERKQPDYSPNAMSHLAERTEYEAWLLEAVYNIVGEEWSPSFPDAVIYPIGSSKPEAIMHGSMNITLSDWRPGFLNAGAPLVFVTTFKLLDMFIEWVLEKNECEATFRFNDKVKLLKSSQALIFPSFIESRPWLKERLIGFYSLLAPLRNTIIHDRHFTSSDGTINVSSRKKKGHGVNPPVEINSSALGALTLIVVSILKYVNGTWFLDQYHEKTLRRKLDGLTHLHGLPSLGQRQPFFTTVRVYSTNLDHSAINLSAVRNDIGKVFPHNDCMFDLRILTVKEGEVINAFLFPWALLGDEGFEWDNISDLEKYQVPIPDDIELKHLAESK